MRLILIKYNTDKETFLKNNENTFTQIFYMREDDDFYVAVDDLIDKSKMQLCSKFVEMFLKDIKFNKFNREYLFEPYFIAQYNTELSNKEQWINFVSDFLYKCISTTITEYPNIDAYAVVNGKRCSFNFAIPEDVLKNVLGEHDYELFCIPSDSIGGYYLSDLGMFNVITYVLKKYYLMLCQLPEEIQATDEVKNLMFYSIGLH